MNKKLKDLASCKSSGELRELLSCYQVDVRSWLQKNGELSFLFGLGAGIVMILFFKFIIFLLALLVIVAALWWVWLEQQGKSS